ncbi:MAG: hypothetical protein HYT80_04430 [Euryarchaeota archaeon]|nr:hypothetical protein [Euryarchaeota archaeon]
MAAKPGRAYVTATRGKDRVTVALDKKGVFRRLELLGAADLGANGSGAQ